MNRAEFNVGGKKYHLYYYKNGITRKGVLLTKDGTPIDYEGKHEWVEPKDPKHRRKMEFFVTNAYKQTYEEAFKKAFGGIDKMAPEEKWFTKYSDYKIGRDKKLKDAGFNVITDPLNEAKSKFDKLQDNKIPLTDKERETVMDKKATWNHGKNGKPSPAVWKSKNKKGDITYITHTHRAYNTAKSLGAAINKYHNFIKGTS